MGEQNLDMITETEKAWSAGFIDADGCISAHIGQGKYVTISVIIVQKDVRPLFEFQRIFGDYEKIGTTRRKDRKNPYFRLTFSGARAGMVLEAVYPYLILKKKQAERGLKIANHIKSLGKGHKMTLDVKLLRFDLAQQIKDLNSGDAERLSESAPTIH